MADKKLTVIAHDDGSMEIDRDDDLTAAEIIGMGAYAHLWSEAYVRMAIQRRMASATIGQMLGSMFTVEERGKKTDA